MNTPISISTSFSRSTTKYTDTELCALPTRQAVPSPQTLHSVSSIPPQFSPPLAHYTVLPDARLASEPTPVMPGPDEADQPEDDALSQQPPGAGEPRDEPTRRSGLTNWPPPKIARYAPVLSPLLNGEFSEAIIAAGRNADISDMADPDLITLTSDVTTGTERMNKRGIMFDTRRRLCINQIFFGARLILNLSNVDLHDAELSGLDLSKANLTNANLRGARLRDTWLIGACLSRADLQGAKMEGAQLRDANLIGARLIDATLIGANLSSALLIGAKLTRAKLFGATLTNADLSSSTLVDVDLTFLRGRPVRDLNISWTKANLRLANLSGLDLSDLSMTRVSLKKAKMCGAILDDTDLSGASLTKLESGWLHPTGLPPAEGGQASTTVIHQPQLKRTKLIGADLSESDFSHITMIGVSIDRAICVATNFSNQDFSHRTLVSINFDCAKLNGTDFVGTVFKNCHGEHTWFLGGNLTQATIDLRAFPYARLAGATMPDHSIGAATTAQTGSVDPEGDQLKRRRLPDSPIVQPSLDRKEHFESKRRTSARSTTPPLYSGRSSPFMSERSQKPSSDPWR